MSVKHASVTVATTATSLVASVPDKSGNNYELGRSIVVTNPGTVSVFIGGPGVTTSAYGYELKAGGELALDLISSDDLFAVAASAQSVRVLHLGV